MLSLILLVFALVLFIIAGAFRFAPTDEPVRGRIVCFGLACAVGANVGQLLDQIVTLLSTADTAYYWTTDAWRTFILQTRTATNAPWNVSDGSDLFAGDTPYSQSITATHNQIANSVYGIGTAVLLNTVVAASVTASASLTRHVTVKGK